MKRRVRWNTDSQNAVRIIQVGRVVKDLQNSALTILVFTSRLELQLDVVWLPRDQNVRPDFFN